MDRAIGKLEKSMDIIEQDVTQPSGLPGYITQQIMQLSQTISYMRKEERETAKNPLESDKLSEEAMLEMLTDLLSEEDLRTLLQKKGGSK